jgi:hypothetical protein
MGLFDAIGSAFGTNVSKAPLNKAASQAKDQLGRGMDEGKGYVDWGVKKAKPYLEDIGETYSPWVAGGGDLFNLYTGALGGSGQEGYDAAQGAFRNSPGFQFGLDAANQNILRNAAATGGVASGGTLLALGNEAQGRQNQEYNTWLDNLYRGSGQGISAAGGTAGGLTSLASLFQDAGSKKADIATGGRSALASNASQLGSNIYQANAQDQANQLGLLQSIMSLGGKALGAFGGGGAA